MATDVLMPKLSDTMEEGKILKWRKQPGDTVRSGDILAEVETDKADMEIESFDEGVVTELRVPEGGSAPVGAVIAVLGAAGDAPKPKPAAAPAPAKEPPAAASSVKEAKATPSRATKSEPPEAPAARSSDGPRAVASAPAEGVKASPLARKVAAERGVDLRSVRGSGPGGRIVQQDVDNAAPATGDREAERPSTEARSGGGTSAATEPARRDAAPAAARPQPATIAAGRHELSRTRKTTAKRMADAKRDVPHFYVSAELAMDEAMRVRDGLAALGEFEGVTVTHLLVKACGLALRRVPEMNASPDVDGIVVHEHVHVGIATATDQGLLVPVVRDVDRTPLAQVVAAARAAVGRARAGKPAGDDLSGATFTISNLGMFPVAHFAAVVNPPQAAILAVGTIRVVPVVRDGAIVPGRLMTVTLSCDHRVVDGALAGRFVAELKTLIENPVALLV